MEHYGSTNANWSISTNYDRPSLQSTDSSLPILHAPHVLREQFVDLLWQAVQASSQSQDLSQVVSRPHKLDVVHVWRKGDASHYGRLRRQVSAVIQSLNGTKVDGQHSLRWLVRPRGDDDEIEKGMVQPEYVASLLSSKMVVVAP